MNLVRLTFVVFLLLFTSCQKEEILQEEISLQEVQLRFEQIEKNTDFLITPQWETFEQGGRNEIGEIYAYVNVLVKEEFNAKLLITDVEGELQMSIVYSSKNKQSLLITDLQGKPKEYYRLTDKGLRMFLVYATPKARASIKECDEWSCMRSLCKSPICSCSCHPQKDYGTVVRPASSFIRNEDPETGEFMGGGVDYFLDEVIVFGERPINRYTPSFPNYNATRYPSFLPDFGFYPFKNGSLFDTEALKDLMSGSSSNSGNITEIKDNIDHELNDYKCAKEIFDKLPTLNNDIAKLLQETFGVSDKVNITFIARNLGEKIDGKVLPHSKSIMVGNELYADQYIAINTTVLENSSQEYILVTMYHEVLHAYLNCQQTILGDIEFNRKYPNIQQIYLPFDNTERVKKYRIKQGENYHGDIAHFLKQLANTIISFNPKISMEEAYVMAKVGIVEDEHFSDKEVSINEEYRNGKAKNGTKCKN